MEAEPGTSLSAEEVAVISDSLKSLDSIGSPQLMDSPMRTDGAE